MEKTFNFSVINLWCNKNLVDTEFVTGEILWKQDTDTIVNFFDNPEDPNVEYVLINTCWFLSSSRNEAEETIQYYDDLWKKTIIIGCYLPVKDDDFLAWLKNLHSIIPYKEIEKSSDILLNNDKINKLKIWLNNIKESKLKDYIKTISENNLNKEAHIWWSKSVRAFFNADYWYEFLKISEWCDNRCSFCIIPQIRWNQKSRTIEDIIKEVEIMVSNWIKEIEIISQDTTRYWIDLYKEASLIKLLKEIDKVDWDFKIRLFYMYPDILTMDSLKELKNIKKLLPYFDIPFQHISKNVLKRMWRFYDDKHIFKVLDFIKKEFDNPFIHTNFIIWFPWETEENFKELLDFVKKYEFDSISVFWYHDEPLAASSKLNDKINDKTIISRVNIFKKTVEKIYTKKEKLRKNKIEIWYITEINEEEQILTVRPEIKAPEIDEYDNISFMNIIEWELYIWEKIKYKLK